MVLGLLTEARRWSPDGAICYPAGDHPNSHLMRTGSMPLLPLPGSSWRNTEENTCHRMNRTSSLAAEFPAQPLHSDITKPDHSPSPLGLMKFLSLFLLLVFIAASAGETLAQQRVPRTMRPNQYQQPGQNSPRFWGQRASLTSQRTQLQIARKSRELRHFSQRITPKYTSPRSFQRSYQTRRSLPMVNNQRHLARRYRFVNNQLRRSRPKLRVISPRQYN